MSRRFEYYFYEPDTAHSLADNAAKRKLPSDVAVLMGTPVASVVQYAEGRNGNAGEHARELSRRIGAKVLGIQDPGPRTTFPDLRAARYRMSPQNFLEYAAELADSLTGYIGEQAIRRVAFRIHSGNGPLGTQLALELDRKENLRVTHAAISDPAGIKEVPSFSAGFRQWLNYRLGDERSMPAEQRSDLGQPPNTLSAFAKDVIVRGGLWRTDITMRNLAAIHADTDIATLLYLPGKTFNGTAEAMQLLSTQWPARDSARPPFEAEYDADGFHGTTYDSFAGNAAFMERAFDLHPFEPTT